MGAKWRALAASDPGGARGAVAAQSGRILLALGLSLLVGLLALGGPEAIRASQGGTPQRSFAVPQAARPYAAVDPHPSSRHRAGSVETSSQGRVGVETPSPNVPALTIRFVGPEVASVEAHVALEQGRSVKRAVRILPGQTRTIDGLPPGRYSIAIAMPGLSDDHCLRVDGVLKRGDLGQLTPLRGLEVQEGAQSLMQIAILKRAELEVQVFDSQGRVHDDVVVEIRSQFDRIAPIRSMTGVDGRVEFSKLNPGSYLVQAELHGDSSGAEWGMTKLELKSGSSATCSLQLRQRDRAMRGCLVDSNGVRLGGVAVILENHAGMTVAKARSNAWGEFRLDGVAGEPGTILVPSQVVHCPEVSIQVCRAEVSGLVGGLQSSDSIVELGALVVPATRVSRRPIETPWSFYGLPLGCRILATSERVARLEGYVKPRELLPAVQVDRMGTIWVDQELAPGVWLTAWDGAVLHAQEFVSF